MRHEWLQADGQHCMNMKDKTPAIRRSRSSKKRTSGTVRLHPRGFGFIETTIDGVATSLFVPPNLVRDILDGDTVTAAWKPDDKGSFTASDIQVTGRSRSLIVGSVTAPGRMDIDPGVGSGNIACEGALIVGDAVVARLTSEPGEPVTGTFERSLGASNEALNARILLRHELRDGHDQATEDEAVKVAAKARRTSGRASFRQDLLEQLVLTIDADHSRDLDDALAVAQDPDGHIRVWVHVADVAEHVRPGSILDNAARVVPTSVYLPDSVRPMLPGSLSEAALSVLPGQKRDVMTVEMRVAHDGTITSADVYESVIRSRRRLSYDTVTQVLTGTINEGDNALGQNSEQLDHDEVEAVRLLHTAASRLGFRRKARGGVDGNRVHLEIPFHGSDSNQIAHKLVERLMVAANETVAEWLTDRGAPALYRVHKPISDESVTELETTAATFGLTVRLPRPMTAQAFGVFAEQIEQHPNAASMWDVVLGMLDRAGYSPVNIGHFGLGSDAYLHFTSPLRRYADLLVHRIVKRYLEGARNGTKTRWGANDLEAMATHIDQTNRRADAAERDTTKAIDLAKIGEPGQKVEGVITSIASRGVTVATPLSTVHAIVPARKLPRGWVLDDVKRRVTKIDGSELTVGSRVLISTEQVDPLVGRFEARIAVAGKRGSTSAANKRTATTARGERRSAPGAERRRKSEQAKPESTTQQRPKKEGSTIENRPTRTKPVDTRKSGAGRDATKREQNEQATRSRSRRGRTKTSAASSTSTGSDSTRVAASTPGTAKPASSRRGRQRRRRNESSES